MGGNRAPDPTTDSDRLNRLEELFEKLQRDLDFQFARTASLQAELDELQAKLARA